jgi:hypothetical protein
MTMGGSTVLGMLSKSLSFTNEMAEITDDAANGYSTYVAEALKKNLEFGISGELEDLSIIRTWFNASQIFAFVITFEDGSTLAFDAAMTGAPSIDMESNGIATYEASFTSSGEITDTWGV